MAYNERLCSVHVSNQLPAKSCKKKKYSFLQKCYQNIVELLLHWCLHWELIDAFGARIAIWLQSIAITFIKTPGVAWTSIPLKTVHMVESLHDGTDFLISPLFLWIWVQFWIQRSLVFRKSSLNVSMRDCLAFLPCITMFLMLK